MSRRYTIGANKPKNRGGVPSSGKQTEDWSPEAKFATVVETAAMTDLD